jgi:hypothetical protein
MTLGRDDNLVRLRRKGCRSGEDTMEAWSDTVGWRRPGGWYPAGVEDSVQRERAARHAAWGTVFAVLLALPVSGALMVVADDLVPVCAAEVMEPGALPRCQAAALGIAVGLFVTPLAAPLWLVDRVTEGRGRRRVVGAAAGTLVVLTAGGLLILGSIPPSG